MIDEELIDGITGGCTPIVPIDKIEPMIAPFIRTVNHVQWYEERCINVDDPPWIKRSKQIFFTIFLQQRLN